MKIVSKASVSSDVYEKDKDVLLNELRHSVCAELVTHDVFIEPARKAPHPFTGHLIEVEMHFFALSYSDVNELSEISKKYPELQKVLKSILLKSK